MEQRAPGVTSQNRDRVRTVSFYAAIALITYLLYVIARPFIVPLCVAAVLTVFFLSLARAPRAPTGVRAPPHW